METSEWCQDASNRLLAALGARYDALTGQYLAPSKDIVTRVTARIDPDVLDATLCALQAELAAGSEPEPGGEQIALDRKVVRSSRGNGYKRSLDERGVW